MPALFRSTGAHVLVDGQFGSTGKGAFAAFLARQASINGAIKHFGGAISSSGPNSGHTSYFKGEKIVLKQLPTFAVHAHLLGYTMPVYLSAGAIINPEVLYEEAGRYPNIPIYVHPNAAIVVQEDREMEKAGSIYQIASTQSGTGAALARKIYRDPSAIARESLRNTPPNVVLQDHRIKIEAQSYFMEVAQGFSLGLNSLFYPHVTSRECTVMQAIADARIPPRHVSMTYMCLRTYPIRVGNLDGHSSGGWYPDQQETSWEALEVPAEMTTVTKRVRRVATFSELQFMEAILANDPDWVAMNFLNYLGKDHAKLVLDAMMAFQSDYPKYVGFIGGFGPNVEDWSFL